jgi:peptidyl-tRNA hydrolase
MPTEKDELFKLSRENLEWFKENYKNIRRDYINQWIVIQNKKIIAKGSTYENITNMLKKADKKAAIVEFIDSKQLAMFF